MFWNSVYLILNLKAYGLGRLPLRWKVFKRKNQGFSTLRRYIIHVFLNSSIKIRKTVGLMYNRISVVSQLFGVPLPFFSQLLNSKKISVGRFLFRIWEHFLPTLKFWFKMMFFVFCWWVVIPWFQSSHLKLRASCLCLTTDGPIRVKFQLFGKLKMVDVGVVYWREIEFLDSLKIIFSWNLPGFSINVLFRLFSTSPRVA